MVMSDNLAGYFVYFYSTNDIVLNDAKAGLNRNVLPSDTQINSLSEMLWTQTSRVSEFYKQSADVNISWNPTWLRENWLVFSSMV